MVDWSKGDYDAVAAVLLPVAEAAVAAAHPLDEGTSLLDVACGTGNVALVAASGGARVTGVDSEPAMVEAARARSAAEGVEGEWLVGTASQLPVPDGTFDRIVSVMGVMFDPDPEAVAAELSRALAPDGMIVVANWTAEGASAAVSRRLRKELDPPRPEGPPPPWLDPERTVALLSRHGLEAEARIDSLPFEADSAEAMVADWERASPFHIDARDRLGEERWGQLRPELVEILKRHNETATGFRTTSTYVLATAYRAREGSAPGYSVP